MILNTIPIKTTSRIIALEIDSPVEPPHQAFLPACTLKWRQGKLRVKQAESGEISAVAVLKFAGQVFNLR